MVLELNVLVHRGHFPDGPVTFSSSKAKLGINMETAAGSPSSYPGTRLVQKCHIHRPSNVDTFKV